MQRGLALLVSLLVIPTVTWVPVHPHQEANQTANSQAVSQAYESEVGGQAL